MDPLTFGIHPVNLRTTVFSAGYRAGNVIDEYMHAAAVEHLPQQIETRDGIEENMQLRVGLSHNRARQENSAGGKVFNIGRARCSESRFRRCDSRTSYRARSPNAAKQSSPRTRHADISKSRL